MTMAEVDRAAVLAVVEKRLTQREAAEHNRRFAVAPRGGVSRAAGGSEARAREGKGTFLLCTKGDISALR